MFKLSIAGVVVRFYLMMAAVIIAGFSGYWAIAILALPIFLSAILGINFNTANAKQAPKVKEQVLTRHTPKLINS